MHGIEAKMAVLAAVLLCFSLSLFGCSKAHTPGPGHKYTPTYKVDIALYDSNEKLLWESATWPDSKWGTKANQFGWIGYNYSLCPYSPENCDGVNNYIGHPYLWTTGNNVFNYLETQQYAVPASFSSRVKSIRFSVSTPSSAKYRVFYNDVWVDDKGSDWTSQDWAGRSAKPEIEYPENGKVGHPLHFSILDVEQDGSVQGNRVLALWISFRSDYSCQNGHHCCHLTNKTDNLWQNGFADDSNNCRIERPYYKCLQTNGKQWSDGKSVGFINFVGSLDSMADGKPISIHFDDNVESAIPFTNSYAQTSVSGESCNTVCHMLYYGDRSHWNTTEWNAAITNCQVKQSKVVANGKLGPIKVTGYGRLSGFTLMDSGPEYFGTQVWKDFDGDNAGSSFQGGSFGDHYKLQEWNVMSGLAELTTSDTSTPFPIELRDVAVAWAPKRGDGAVLVNAPYRGLDNHGDSNKPAFLWDIKTPGAWMDAADGPNLMGDGSVMQYAYLHHADDLLKISASNVNYYSITALQGNTGSVIEVSNYGDGLRTNTVANSVVDRISVHRINHVNGGYDGNGGIFATRTCPNNININNITVNGLVIPKLDTANTVDQLFAIGGISGNLPFCQGNQGPVTIKNLYFQNWRIYVNPSMMSKIYNGGGNTVTVSNVNFYDTSQKDQSGILASAVQIFDSTTHYYCICAVQTGAEKCWDMTGPGQGAQNTVYDNVQASDINFPYGQADSTSLPGVIIF